MEWSNGKRGGETKEKQRPTEQESRSSEAKRGEKEQRGKWYRRWEKEVWMSVPAIARVNNYSIDRWRQR